MKKFVFLVATCLLLLSNCSQLKKSMVNKSSGSENSESLKAELNLPVKKYTLDNGLRVLVYENRRLPIFSYYTFFNVGGRHEGAGTTGATHFLEHMMFKGAKKYGPGQFDSTIEGNGGSTNAYTTFDSTVYYESMPSPMLSKIIDMEADRMEHLLLEPKALESERQVVFEERKMRYENSDRGKLYLSMMKAVFEKTPYGGSVIGEVADLKALSRDNLMDFFKKFYTPDNAIIVIAGDVDGDDTFAKIKEKFGHLSPSSREIIKYKSEKDAPKRYTHKGRYGRDIKIHGQSPTPLFMVAYEGKPIGEREGFVMDILSSMLGDGSSSYMAQKYVKGKKPILESISMYNYTLMFNGVLYINGKLLPKVNYKRFMRNLKRDLPNMCEKGLDERALQRTKNQYLLSYFKDIQTNAGVARFLGTREMIFKDYAYYKKEIDIYNSISLEEVKKSCHRVLKNKKPITLSIWNKYPKN